MTQSERPTLARAWPAIAASIAAFAGMSSCIATVWPLTVFGAPLVGIGVTALVFTLLLRLRPAAASEAEQRDRVRFAAAIAWMVCIATCWRFATRTGTGLTGEASAYRGAVSGIAIAAGAVGGFVVALVIEHLGMAQRLRAPAVASMHAG